MKNNLLFNSKTPILAALCCFFCLGNLLAQQDSLVEKKRKDLAIEAINDLKKGALIIRLRTKTQTIAALKRIADDTTRKPKQRKRHQTLLDDITQKRDAINWAMLEPARDSFTFCKTYFMFDTESRLLLNGTRKGIFLNDSMRLDTSIMMVEEPIFILDFVERNAQYPYDVLVLQRLKGDLFPPFPNDMPIRASFVTDATDILVRKGMFRYFKRLEHFYKNKN